MVAIENGTDADPAGTVTLAGTEAMAGFPLVRFTTIPPAGAAPRSVIVPVEAVPPVTVDGVSTRLVKAARFTVKLRVFVNNPCEAEIVAVTDAATGVVVIVKVAERSARTEP